MKRFGRWISVGALLTAVALTAIACGGNDNGGDASGGDVSADVQQELAALWKGESYGRPPTGGPKPQRDKKIWVFSCFEADDTCATPAHAAVEAAESIGWKAKLFDTRSEPARIAEGVRQAIADGADGITLWGLDCEQIGPQPLRELREAGVMISAAESLDCDEPQFDAVVSYSEGPYEQWFRAFGRAQATALIAATEGNAKVIVFSGPIEALSLGLPREGFKEKLESCGGCEIVEEVQFTVNDLFTTLEQKAAQALVKHPEANAVYSTTDGTLIAGVRTALKASGRAKDIVVTAGEGQPWTMADLRDGSLRVVGVGIPQVWEGYQIVDNLIRLFAGEDPVPSGIGLQAYDKDHNLPDDGPYRPPVEFRELYWKAWGVGV